jgi:hypothetical protein
LTNTVSSRIDDDTLSAAIQIESGGRPAVKAQTSSATGLGQFVNKTWDDTVRKHRPDVLKKYGRDVTRSLRTNPSFSIEMLARLWEDSLDIIGSKATPGDLYLAHFLGVGTARNVTRQPTSRPVEEVVSEAAVNANLSILQGKTCGQVRAWASRKMAQAGGHNWVQKWYDPNDPLVKPMHEPEELEFEAEHADVHKIEEPYDEPDDGTAPVDVTPHGEVNDKIANLQKALVDMGYVEVGMIEGAWGGGTKAAIAAFLNDRGRDDLMANMSQPVLDEIAHARLEGFKRPVSEERATKTAKDLAPNNATVRSTLRTKALGFWGMITGTAVTVFNAVSTYFTSAWDMIKPVREALGHVHWSVYAIIFVGVCIFLYKNADDAEKDTTDAFQTRRLLR